MPDHLPKRYQFDNHLPTAREPAPLVHRPVPLPEQQAPVVHYHQAPPDRTIQRLALGSGVGAGAVAAGVYFGPLLIAAMTSIAISLAVAVLALAVTAWAVTTVVKSVGGTEGQAAAQALGKARKSRRKR